MQRVGPSIMPAALSAYQTALHPQTSPETPRGLRLGCICITSSRADRAALPIGTDLDHGMASCTCNAPNCTAPIDEPWNTLGGAASLAPSVYRLAMRCTASSPSVLAAAVQARASGRGRRRDEREVDLGACKERQHISWPGRTFENPPWHMSAPT